MQVIPNIDMITKGTVKIGKKTYPIIDINVYAGSYSNPVNLDFKWVTKSMTKRSVTFQLVFT